MTPEALAQELAQLRERGAAQCDPLRLHYITVLAERAANHQGSVKRLLDAKLAQALQSLRARCDAAQGETQAADGPALPQTGPSALSALVHYAAQQSSRKGTPAAQDMGGVRPVLPATRFFRTTLSKLNVQKRVTQALNQAPQNAGPLNAHNLVLRSLSQLRDISPDYVNRLTAYVDTLLCLDQWEATKAAQTKTAAEAPGKSKLKPKPKARRTAQK